MPELLHVKGTEVVGPLPGDLQNVTMFAAGIPSGAAQAGRREGADPLPADAGGGRRVEETRRLNRRPRRPRLRSTHSSERWSSGGYNREILVIRWPRAFAALLLFGTTADAAEIKVYATIGMGSVLKELQPKFEQASGHKLDITWGLAGALAKRVADGESPDASSPSRVASTAS